MTPVRSGLRSQIKHRILKRLPASAVWHYLNLKGLLVMKKDHVPRPLPMSIPNEAVRLYIGPANYAGQGSAWAEAVTRWMPGVAAANMIVVSPDDYHRYPSSYSIPQVIYLGSLGWNRDHRNAMLKFTHVLIEASIPNVRSRFYSDVSREAEWLKRSGVSVGWMCHGTEVRLPSRHRMLEPWSPYVPPSSHYDEDRRARGNLRTIHNSGLPVFVSTPDLLVDVPGAEWCPVVVEPDRWRVDNRPLAGGGRLRVLHSPTNRTVKGTELVLPTLRRLEEEGVLQLELAEGIPNSQMPELLARTDIIIDQFRIGSYGVAACEAMAAGRIVVSHVSDQVREAVRERTGLELPIVEATPDSLEKILRSIHADRHSGLAAAARGPEFVRAVHDGRLSVEALSAFLSKKAL